MGRVEARLQELGIELPTPPAPVASYVPFVIVGNVVHVSGQVSVDASGGIKGKLGDLASGLLVDPVTLELGDGLAGPEDRGLRVELAALQLAERALKRHEGRRTGQTLLDEGFHVADLLAQEVDLARLAAELALERGDLGLEQGLAVGERL